MLACEWICTVRMGVLQSHGSVCMVRVCLRSRCSSLINVLHSPHGCAVASVVQPPEQPDRDNPHSVWYELLRPELVRMNPKPLCSDAFTNWMRHDANRKQLNNDVALATNLYVVTCERVTV